MPVLMYKVHMDSEISCTSNDETSTPYAWLERWACIVNYEMAGLPGACQASCFTFASRVGSIDHSFHIYYILY